MEDPADRTGRSPGSRQIPRDFARPARMVAQADRTNAEEGDTRGFGDDGISCGVYKS
jgi:hypothetical protein